MPKAKLYRRPDGLYEKKLTIGGKRVVFRAKTEREVMQKIAAYQRREESGVTFAEAAAEWWEHKEPRLSPNTVSGYRVAMRRAVERFGDMPVKDITATQVRGWLDWLTRRGYARKAVGNHLIVATAVFAWACENHNAPTNPAALVHIPDGLAKSRRTMPTQAEIDAIKARAHTPDGRPFYFLMYTGLRLGEALALLLQAMCSTGVRVSEVQYLTVEALGRSRMEVHNKGKSRTVLLPGALCEKLRLYCEKRGIREGSVFVTRTGRPLNRSNIWLMMKALCGAARVDERKVFPHNLRHLFARCFYQAQKDIEHLATILGHSSIDTTRIYTQTSGAEHRRQLEQLHLLI